MTRILGSFGLTVERALEKPDSPPGSYERAYAASGFIPLGPFMALGGPPAAVTEAARFSCPAFTSRRHVLSARAVRAGSITVFRGGSVLAYAEVDAA